MTERIVVYQGHEESYVHYVIHLVELFGKRCEGVVRTKMYILG